MNIEEEIKREKKLKAKREWILGIGGILYTIIAIVIVLFGQPVPIVTDVLIPLSIGIGVGLLLSMVSTKLSYDTSTRLIRIQSALDEMKNDSKVLDDKSLQETTESYRDNKQTSFWKKSENKLMIISIIVALTIGIPTIYLGLETGFVLEEIKKVNDRQFEIQNFQWDLFGNVSPLVLENRSYNNESLNQKISLSIVSPHYLKIVVTSVEIQNDDQSKKLPQVYLEEQIIRVLPSGVSNIDINVPIRLNFDPTGGYGTNNVTSSLGEIRYNFEVTNIQTKEPITNGFVHSSFILE